MGAEKGWQNCARGKKRMRRPAEWGVRQEAAVRRKGLGYPKSEGEGGEGVGRGGLM